MMIYINLVYEDVLSEMVMRKLLGFFNQKYYVEAAYNKHGCEAIKRDLKSYNEAAKHKPFFVMTDLDQNECPPTLIKEWVTFKKNPHLIFRVAVKEIESWLLADRNGFASFASVALSRIPVNPEVLPDPKRALFEIIKKSRKRELKQDILPRYEGDRMGPNYNGCLSEFVIKSWDIKRASKHSPSLKRAFDNLQNFQKQVKK